MNIEQTLELLRAANPVPDEAAVDQPTESSAAYLSMLEQRSDDMRLVEELDMETLPTPNRVRMTALAVAAVVLLAAIGYGIVSLIGPGNDVIDGEGIDLSDPATVLPGTWESVYGEFTFGMDGSYSVTADGKVLETGTYRVTVPPLVALVADPESPQCAGETDVLSVTAESADELTFRWEAVGCEAHFVLDCFLPGGGGEGCGRFDRISD